MANEITISNDNFTTEVIESEIPVVVDFWAEWCGPCKMIGPLLEKLSEDYAGKIKIAKVNVDENGELAQKYSVVSIPMLLLFKNGEVINQQVGAVPRETIESMFKDHI